MSKKQRILLVEDDVGLQSQLRWALENYQISVASDRASAVAAFREDASPVVVLDLGLPPDPDGASEGLACLRELLAIAPETKIIISSGNENRANAVDAIASGAYDFYAKPVDIDVLTMIIERALHLYQLEEEARQRAATVGAPLAGLITNDPGMLKVCRSVEKVAPTGVSVMLLGESGTGKDVLARAIHHLSPRAARPFVAINCAAIPENLLESELFGHEKGAFTGAIKQIVGKIETANRGTFFLDEIGDLPLSLQAKLLRFLQDRVIERVGGRQQIPVDVRIISATNKNIPDLIRDGRFREDLFYRLNEVRIDIPPLRERAGDVVLLINYFIGEYCRQHGRLIKGLAQDAIEAILAYPWPGNVREIDNRVKRAVIMSEGKLLTAADLDFVAQDAPETVEYDLRIARERAERSVVQRVLLKERGNISKAARLLGISRPTLYELMKQLNIKT